MKAKKIKKIVDKGNVESEKAESEPKFCVDYDAGGGVGVSLALIIASRKCNECRRNDIQSSVAQSDPVTHVKRISQHCLDTDDYLPPDTPLKEAIFKILLSKRNRGMTADEISAALTEKWSKSINRREISAGVTRRLLEISTYYRLVTQP